MARTNRKAALAAAPAANNVDALDDLNLDDMFEEGDDTLFDGLDIDLDGMGEIHDPKDTKKGAPKDLDAAKLDLLGDVITAPAPAPAAAASSSPPRRKTKRKIKAPPTMDDDDDEDYELPKKKRKSSKSGSKKAKGSTKTTGKKSTASQAAKAKAPSAIMPPPMSRTSAELPKGMVPVTTNQFSVKNQKKGASYTQPLVRQSSKTSKGRASPSSVSTSSQQSTGPMAIGDHRRPSLVVESPSIQPESTFCGLRPSNNEFYPFMAGLPLEPSLKKTHRFFPVIYSIHSAITSSTPSPSSISIQEHDALFRLLSADLDQQSDRNTSEAARSQRRVNLGQSIAATRMAVSQIQKKKLLSDLSHVCALLKRQYDFLNQNLENMERWCNGHFEPHDYQAVYGTPPSGGGGKRGSQPSLSVPPKKSGANIFASLKSPIVKIRVRCTGFKNPKSGPLIAHVRVPGLAPPPAVKTEAAPSKPKVKRKASSVELDRSSARSSISASSLHESSSVAVEAAPSYADMTPTQRRQRVTEAVAQRAQSLESKIRESNEKRRKVLDRQGADLQKVVEDDEIVHLNTMTMWKWLEKSSYFSDYSAADARDALESLWEPQVTEWKGAVAPLRVKSEQVPESERKESSSPADSIFLRLQSLLVDEGSDDEENDGDSHCDNWDVGDDESNDKSSMLSNETTVLDLTELTLDERAYIHLRAAGLIDDDLIDSRQPALVNEDDTSRQNGAGDTKKKASSKDTGGIEAKNDMDDIVQAMQEDLIGLGRLNNSRIAFLESQIRSHLESAKELKRKEEENAAMISRYNQMQKRQKEAKRSSRHKPVKTDGDWVPW